MRRERGPVPRAHGWRRGRRVWATLVLVDVMVLMLAGAVRAQTVCTAADIIASDPVNCPNSSAPCTITKTLQVGNGCMLDFGPRAVTISPSGILRVNNRTMTLNADSLTIAPGSPGGFIDGRGNQSSVGGDQGGMVMINTTGDVNLQHAPNLNGVIDVSGNAGAGTIAITAGGKITVAGHLEANQLPGMSTASGGTIRLNAGTDILMPKNGEISATGGILADSGGGLVDLTAGGQVVLGDQVSVSGASGGTLMASAGTTVTLQGVSVNGTGDGNMGGEIDIAAGAAATRAIDGAVNLLGALTAQGGPPTSGTGGCGGTLCIASCFGDITVAGAIQAEGTAGTVGAASDGGGGMITLMSQGSTIIQKNATVSARSNGFTGCGGSVSLQPNLGANIQAKLDASGGGMGGGVDICAGTDVTLGALLVPIVDASGSGRGGAGGMACISAGTGIDILGTVDVTGTDDPQAPGSGGSTAFSACNITVEATGKVRANAPGDGGTNDFMANERINILAGSRVDAQSTRSGDPGTNTLEYPSRNPPVLAGTILPPIGVIVSVTPGAPGDGYVVGDVLAIGTGTGGQATVTSVTMGRITRVEVAAPGTGYSAGDVLTITTGTLGKVLVTAVDGTGAVTNVALSNGGSGYVPATGLATTGGHGTGCTISVTATVASGVMGVSLKSGGTGYGTGNGKPTTGGRGTGCTVNITVGTTLTPMDTCTQSNTQHCLFPCPVCGNGVVEFPEDCDNGTGQSCLPAISGSATNCSAFCLFENCDDGLVCTFDVCDPKLGCHFVEATTPCVEPPTSTPTITRTPSLTPTPGIIPTPTITPTGMHTQTPTSTFATPTPTPAVPADANCDGRITAADVTAVVMRLGSTPVCGTDANLDGKVDTADINLTIAKIF